MCVCVIVWLCVCVCACLRASSYYDYIMCVETNWESWDI